MTAYLNIGSNLGDSRLLIMRAVDAIGRLEGTAPRLSDWEESEPWGFTSENRFLNIGVSIETGMEPHQLLCALQDIERGISPASHRNPDGTYRDRHIDIDIIAIDSLTISTPTLSIPHPLMHLRTFVLRPLAQLAPAWRHPVTGLSAAEMLERL